jgi:hypothetical protein
MHGVRGISKSRLVREFAEAEIYGSHSASGCFLDKRVPLYRSWREAGIFMVKCYNPGGEDIAAPKAEDDRNWFRSGVEHTGQARAIFAVAIGQVSKKCFGGWLFPPPAHSIELTGFPIE